MNNFIYIYNIYVLIECIFLIVYLFRENISDLCESELCSFGALSLVALFMFLCDIKLNRIHVKCRIVIGS